MKSIKKQIIISLILIIFGVVGRIVIQTPNVETVTAATLLASATLSFPFILIVPLTIIGLTDIYFGNDAILLFTWSAWAIIALLNYFFYRKKKFAANSVAKLTLSGICSSSFFFIYTNFGVWVLWNMYPHNLQGLFECYIMAIPFFKNNLVSDLIFIPTSSIIFLLCLKIIAIWKKRGASSLALR